MPVYVALRIPGAVHLKCFMYDLRIPVTEHILSINHSHSNDNEMGKHTVKFKRVLTLPRFSVEWLRDFFRLHCMA